MSRENSTAGTNHRGRTAVMALCGSAALLLSALPAAADLRVCNSTDSRVGVAIGYKDEGTWTTEGWWNIPAQNCETLLRGDLNARYYYVHAIDYDNNEAAWDGQVPMCARTDEFTIRGIENCLARGYERLGFFEVDTEENRTWEVLLKADDATAGTQQTDGPAPGATVPGTTAAASGDALVPFPPGRPAQ